ncbi:MAG: CRISPR-associated endonuclease Cas2 [Thaumarchaeota archaeon]|jgi:CRISPR-associated protein Cas2|nr:CRISPR-associated endonuclease Cas2 [Candidatus Terraquivivens yellowstonensis]
MYTLVIYDITDDMLRLRIAEACKEFGLVRIQKSAFLGRIDFQRRKGLRHRLKEVLGNNPGNIQIFLICEADMRFREMIGEPTGYEEEGIMFL